MNDICKNCEHIRNCINGKFCILAGKYVEYAKIQICETSEFFDKNEKTNNKQ